MNTRPISVFAILQTAALCFGVLFTGVFCRISGRFLESNLPDLPKPSGYLEACAFRDHGAWILLLIFAWTSAALYISNRDDLPWFTERLVIAAETAALIIIGLAGFYFATLATSPFWML